MAIYAVGDIQGCFEPLKRVLDSVGFDSSTDHLWCTGDLVNRGPDSLEVLRFMLSLGDRCITVLGNHDLHLLTLAAGGDFYRRDSLRDVLDAADAAELLDWLRHRPMMVDDENLGLALVHAGLHPAWDIATALQRAGRVEAHLQGDGWQQFCLQMHHEGYPSALSDVGSSVEDELFTIGVMTRARYCTADGVFDWKNRSGPAVTAEQQPWFEFTHAPWRKQRRIVYGHWAAKGLVADQPHVLGLDSGCVWGGALSLARLDDDNWPPAVTQCDCPAYQQCD